MTFEEYVKIYEKKAEPYTLEPGYTLYFDENHGFITYKKMKDTLLVDHCCSINDLPWMIKKAQEIAKEQGCIYLATQTCRSARAYIRRGAPSVMKEWHLDLSLSGYRKNGKFYWCFIVKI